jgi:hypothetical protein
LTRALGASLLVVAAAAAQNTIVSPVQSASTPGGGGNTIPWSSSQYRYMQVHSDIGGMPMLVRKLAFRQAPSTANYTGVRNVDLELHMGHTVAYDLVRHTYNDNFITPRVNVFTRKIINFGPQGQAASPGPNPFVGMDIVLDVPFPYTGAFSLGWDVAMYSNVLASGNWNSANPDQSSASGSTAGTITGAGCGSSHTVSIADNGGSLSTGFALSAAPAGRPTLLAIGGTNPNLAVPGLCSPLQTDLAVMLAVGATSATGAIPLGGGASFHLGTNVVQGATLYSQMHTLDPASTNPIPVVNSNGRSFVVPVSNTTKVIKATRLYNSSAAATTANWATVGVVGYALVTQFTY